MSTVPTTYHVWRRSDGYVAASATHRDNFTVGNGRDTFETLLVTQEWSLAFARIGAERDDRHWAAVASWTNGLPGEENP